MKRMTLLMLAGLILPACSSAEWGPGLMHWADKADMTPAHHSASASTEGATQNGTATVADAGAVNQDTTAQQNTEAQATEEETAMAADTDVVDEDGTGEGEEATVTDASGGHSGEVGK